MNGSFDSEIRHDREGDYHTLVRVSVDTEGGPRSVAGTLFGSASPRLVELFGVGVEAELVGEMIYIVNEDAPGFIGRLGTTLGGPGSISPPSISAGARPAARRSPWSRSTAISRRTCCEDVEAIPGVKRVTPLRF